MPKVAIETETMDELTELACRLGSPSIQPPVYDVTPEPHVDETPVDPEPPADDPPEADPLPPIPDGMNIMPKAWEFVCEKGMTVDELEGSGKGGRITLTDVKEHYVRVMKAPQTPLPDQKDPIVPPTEDQVSITNIGDDEEDESSQPDNLTLEDARDALSLVTEAHGMDTGLAFLQTFGVEKVSDLDPKQYAEVIEKANDEDFVQGLDG